MAKREELYELYKYHPTFVQNCWYNDGGEKEANIFRHDNLFILFLHVQLLIIVVYIYLLILSDIDTMETIPYILRSWSINYMFIYWLNLIVFHIKPIAAESKYSQSRYFFFEVVHFVYLSDVSIRSLLFISIEELEEGFGGYSLSL